MELTSFYITYAFLITTGTITFIEAIRTANPTVRHIMNLETVISVIAGFFYYAFIEKIKSAKDEASLAKDINRLRYTDWMISTPFMLLSLCIVLGYENKVSLSLLAFASIVLLDYGMLYLGYAGEMGLISKKTAWLASFACFAALFAMIYVTFLYGRSNATAVSRVIFAVFAGLWSVYGWVYFAGEDVKNRVFNILDLCAKCLLGIFFWMYYTKVVLF